MSTNIGWSSPNIPPQKLLSPLVLNLGAEVMNFPSLERADATQPLWFAKSANCTLTEEDVAGESGLTELYNSRTLKVATTATGTYAYQRFTYADQPRLKAGRTVAMMVAVWSNSGVPSRISLYSSVGFLAQSIDTTVAGWTILEIPQTVLDGTYVDIRMEVDNGTGYFIPITPWPRGLIERRLSTAVAVETLSGQSSKAVADLDLTSNTSNLAVMVELSIHMAEFSSGEAYKYFVRMNGSSATVTGDVPTLRGRVQGLDASAMVNNFWELCDDGQIIETALVRDAGAGTILLLICNLIGWREWA